MKVKISFARDLQSLRLVLKDPNSVGPDPVYWVFNEIGGDWLNMTVITPGSYNGEYPKTFGHYHEVGVGEAFKLVQGEGVLFVQKRAVENGAPIADKIEEVICIKAVPGDEISITPEYAHSWINIGSSPLIIFDNWGKGHLPADYKEMGSLHGLCYYLINKEGQVSTAENANYKVIPPITWLTAEEFKNKLNHVRKNS